MARRKDHNPVDRHAIKLFIINNPTERCYKRIAYNFQCHKTTVSDIFKELNLSLKSKPADCVG